MTLLSSGSSANYSLAFPAVAPSAGNFLTSDTSGQMSWSSTAGFSSTTTAAMTVYVRSDGSDTTCNGSANASVTSAPNCAFMTLQTALDKTPDILKHTVTIKIGTTLNAPTANRPMAIVNKLITAANETLGPMLIIEGNGGMQALSNFQAGASGILISKASRGVYLKNLNLNAFPETAVDVDGGVALFENSYFAANRNSVKVSRGGIAQFIGNSHSM
ncbi:MAG: hypothetical protein EOP49_45695, partial [Sphingobacteriales bacterium]